MNKLPPAMQDQSSLEIILLIGGVILVAIIILIFLATGVTPIAGTSLQTNLFSLQNVVQSLFLSVMGIPPAPNPIPIIPIAPGFLSLGTSSDGLQFQYVSSPNPLLILTSLTHANTTYALSSDKLWEIELETASNSTILVNSFTSHVPVTFSHSMNGADQVTTFFWDDVPISGSTDAVDVHVRVTDKSNSDDFVWEITVFSPSNYILRNVSYPDFELGQVSQTSINDFILFPFFGGSLVKEPFATLPSFSTRHPSNAFQFMHRYDPSSLDGIYLAALDGSGYAKDIVASTTSIAVNWSIKHLVPESGAVSYSIPYPLVVSYVSGNWFDAAQKYRQWAITQPMTARGKWALSNEVSPRAKYADALFLLSPASEQFNAHDIIAQELISASTFLGTENVLGYWYRWHVHSFDQDWPDYEPKSTFRAAVTAVHNAKPNLTIMPYFNPGTWSESFSSPSYYSSTSILSRVCLQKDGSPYVNSITNSANYKWDYYWTDPSMQVNRNHEKDVIADFLAPQNQPAVNLLAGNGFGVDGVYYDYYSGLPAQVCYNNPSVSGHPKHGGTYWSDGQKQLLQEVHTVGKSLTDGTFMLSSEHVDEMLIPSLDMTHYYPIFGFDFSSSFPVPVYGAIYHDYILNSSLGVMASPASSSWTSQNLDVSFQLSAYEYTTGKLVSMGNWFADTVPFFNPLPAVGSVQRENIDFIKILTSSYAYTRPYVLWGEMLHPLPNTYLDNLDIVYALSHKQPAASVWRRVDITGNNVGIVIVNPYAFSVSLNSVVDLPAYGFTSTQVVAVQATTASSTPLVNAPPSTIVGSWDMSGFMVPAHSVVLLELH